MNSSSILSYVDPIEDEQEEMVTLLEAWSRINSSSNNLEGLHKQMKLLQNAFKKLNGVMEEIPLPPVEQVQSNGEIKQVSLGNVLSIAKHPSAPIQIFLGGHMDTVFSVNHPFQHTSRPETNVLKGPGVADMKGGLVIMLKALQVLEKSPFAGQIGWQVIINADEEIGSIGSASIIRKAAKNKQIGLIFEPSYPDGSLVSSRKGSFNFTIVARGKAAHAGRNFVEGRNAIVALARLICEINDLNDPSREITVNVGTIEGGQAVNIVPDIAICRFNIRTVNLDDFFLIKETVQNIIAVLNAQQEVQLSFYQQGERSPKIFDDKHRELFVCLRKASLLLGASIDWKPSGGICDGNILFEEGIPSIDTLGAIGGGLHTSDEFVYIDSLVKRAKLTALFLLQYPSLKDAQ